MRFREGTPGIIIILLAVDVLLVILFLVDLALGTPFTKFTNAVDLGSRSSLPAWYSSIQLFILAQLWFAVFADARSHALRFTWTILVVPVTYLALSIDAAYGIHEMFILRATMVRWLFTTSVPIALIFVYASYILGRRSPGHWAPAMLFASGMVLFGAAILISDLYDHYVAAAAPARIIQLSLRELGANIGVTFAIWGLLKSLAGSNAYQLLIGKSPTVHDRNHG